MLHVRRNEKLFYLMKIPKIQIITLREISTMLSDESFI